MITKKYLKYPHDKETLDRFAQKFWFGTLLRALRTPTKLNVELNLRFGGWIIVDNGKGQTKCEASLHNSSLDNLIIGSLLTRELRGELLFQLCNKARYSQVSVCENKPMKIIKTLI